MTNCLDALKPLEMQGGLGIVEKDGEVNGRSNEDVSKGGSCGGEVQPTSKVVRDGDSESMHAMQMKGFEDEVMTLKYGGSRMKMMDITKMFSYRRDGHPGPYRCPDSNKPKEGPKA
ncbi:uncharacterized protein A4U43_C01F15330 [Asparagus officinalis]|uniref:Trichome birefringence-like C-terminal domain-containing protein n=1 Tax=Asparagus officinalis TaxID=4686 RepID=A0A5P1FPS2_ASPOF|nr:uncharacterized protein A4U43_C01F15330 [Asparagus officinalis]